MPRFEVTIRLLQVHHFAQEATSANEAQSAALDQVNRRDPENTEIEVTVERGVG